MVPFCSNYSNPSRMLFPSVWVVVPLRLGRCSPVSRPLFPCVYTVVPNFLFFNLCEADLILLL
jgi:hypothetical protein